MCVGIYFPTALNVRNNTERLFKILISGSHVSEGTKLAIQKLKLFLLLKHSRAMLPVEVVPPVARRMVYLQTSFFL